MTSEDENDRQMGKIVLEYIDAKLILRIRAFSLRQLVLNFANSKNNK